MKVLVPVLGAAVARPSRQISAAGRRHGDAPSASRLLRPQAARENCWPKSYSVLCLFSVVRWESVMSDRLHRGHRHSAMGLEGCSARPRPRPSRGPLRRLLAPRGVGAKLEVTPQPLDKFVDRAEVCSMFVLTRPGRQRGVGCRDRRFGREEGARKKFTSRDRGQPLDDVGFGEEKGRERKLLEGVLRPSRAFRKRS